MNDILYLTKMVEQKFNFFVVNPQRSFDFFKFNFLTNYSNITYLQYN